MEATIAIDITQNDRYTIHNAVTAEVNRLLGFSLPGPFEQVMYVIEKCYVGCGWAAYAYINSWMSVYQSNYYYQPGVQVHELGHNFNLAHSGGLDGNTYTDHTCMMGNPLYSDEVGKMCYNAAKNWQLDWYGGKGTQSQHKQLIDPFQTLTSTVELVGIGEYDKITANRYVVIKLETGTSTDIFIGFNRAAGPNAQNDEADDEVTITESGNNGEGYSQSYLKAHLVAGETYTYESFANSGRILTITANSIDLTTEPGIATVTIALQPLCSNDSDCDDGKYCNGIESCNADGICQSAGSPCGN
eukprot:15348337-Ditylum_brightwellii.AAC.1